MSKTPEQTIVENATHVARRFQFSVNSTEVRKQMVPTFGLLLGGLFVTKDVTTADDVDANSVRFEVCSGDVTTSLFVTIGPSDSGLEPSVVVTH